ncbi:30597_t:CDS:1, partial [Gigaspora margarita]
MNSMICEVVPSIRGRDKINVYGFLMYKDKSRRNTFYWYCEKKDILSCNGRAVTRLINNQHYLRHMSDHNHGASASRSEVARVIGRIREQACQTSESPAQIMQTAITNSSQNIYPYLPLYNAIRQTIQRVRYLDLPTEPLTLDSFVIPDHIKQTLKG